MRESAIERHLVAQCKARGWLALKFVSPGRAKVADRLVVPNNGRRMFFVECKAPGVDIAATPHGRAQLREHARMRALGQTVYVVSTVEEVDRALADDVKPSTLGELVVGAMGEGDPYEQASLLVQQLEEEHDE